MKPVNMAVGTPYGRKGPMWKSCGWHTGDDFECDMGTRLVAAISGTIRHRNYGKSFGPYQFAISPSPGQPFADGEVFYAHTLDRLPDGTEVQMGDFVARSGNLGNVSGPHLHFEFHPNTKNQWGCNVVADPQPIYDHGPQGGGGSSSGAITKNIHSEKLGMGEPTNGDDKSATVEELQRKLNSISLVGGTTIPITGRYDSITDAEVRKWQQQICGDTPDPAGRSFLGKRQRERMFPASEGYVIHDNGLPAIASRPVGPEPEPPAPGVPPCPPADQFKMGVTNSAFTWMGQRFLVWLSPQEIAKEGSAYEPGPRFSEYDEQNIRKCQSKMGDTPDPPGSAFFGPKQWARLAEAPPNGNSGGTDSGSGSINPDPGPGGDVADAPGAPALMYPQAQWDPIAKKGGGWITGLRPFSGKAKKITLHTTETKVKPNWVQQQTGIPHFTIDLKSEIVWQHLPLDIAAYTLRGPDGISNQSPNSDSGVNIQIEIVGYSADVRLWTNDEYDYLSMLCSWICDVTGVPFECPLPFAEAGDARRLGWMEWAEISGIVGHEHAPHNDHTDPGAFNSSRLINHDDPDQPNEGLPDWIENLIQSNWTPIIFLGTAVLIVLLIIFR